MRINKSQQRLGSPSHPLPLIFPYLSFTNPAILSILGKPFSFDNAYYKDMLSKPWLDTVSNNGMNIHIGIESDHKLAEDADARAICAQVFEHCTP